MKRFLQTTSSNSKNQKPIQKLPGGLTLTQFISVVTFVMGIITIYIHLEVRVAEINVDLANLKQDMRMHKSENQKDFETLHYDISSGNKEILRNVNEIQIYLRNKKLSYDRKTTIPQNPLIPDLQVGAIHPEFDHSTKQTMKLQTTSWCSFTKRSDTLRWRAFVTRAAKKGDSEMAKSDLSRITNSAQRGPARVSNARQPRVFAISPFHFVTLSLCYSVTLLLCHFYLVVQT
jgi:hypothetical protein